MQVISTNIKKNLLGNGPPPQQRISPGCTVHHYYKYVYLKGREDGGDYGTLDGEAATSYGGRKEDFKWP